MWHASLLSSNVAFMRGYATLLKPLVYGASHVFISLFAISGIQNHLIEATKEIL